MIRVIAFVLSICCCVGLLSGVHRAVNAQEENLVFTENVIEGDSSVAEGLTVGMEFGMGEHLRWDIRHALGNPQGDVDFTFFQFDPVDKSDGYYNHFRIYTSTGFGFSTSGVWDIPDTPMGSVFRAAYDNYLATGEKTMEVRLADYFGEYPMEFELSYQSEGYYCHESVSHIARLTHTGDYESGSATYDALMELFDFRVPETVQAEISLEIDAAGRLSGAGMNTMSETDIAIEGQMNDDGIWFVPYGYALLGQSGAQSTVCPDGFGVYFIPWKETGEIQHLVDGTDRAEITGDVANMRNIYPMDDSVQVFGFRMDPTYSRLVLLTLEDGMINVVFLDLATGEETHRFELMPPYEENPGWISWAFTEDATAVYTRDQAAVLDTSGEPELVFVTAGGQNMEPLDRYYMGSGALVCKDGQLRLTGTTWDHTEAYYVAVYDGTGLLYYGTYGCSLLETNNPGYRYQISDYGYFGHTLE